jgi:hypothetical protein
MTPTTPELAQAYSEASANHDVDAIVALHAEDAVFHLHDVLDPFVGRAAIAATATQFLTESPDLRFDTVRLHLGPDHLVPQYVMRGTRDGRPFPCHGTDIYSVRDGLVARNDSNVDWLAYQRQPASSSPFSVVARRSPCRSGFDLTTGRGPANLWENRGGQRPKIIVGRWHRASQARDA